MIKGEKITGYFREDCNGFYLTNGKTCFEDGDTKIRIDSKFNGRKVSIEILENYDGNWQERG